MPMTSVEGVDDSLYGDDKPKDAPESVDQEESMNPTTLVDLKILTGKDGAPPKVGEERVVKVVAVHGDQAEIEYAPEKPDNESTETKPDMEPDEELAQMSKEY
jgi:hypothetical protein